MTAEEEEAIEQLAQTVQIGTTFAGVINFFVSFTLAYALKYLWNMVGLFQFLVFVEKW